MPISPMNFANIPPQGHPFWQQLLPNISNAFTIGKQAAELPYAGELAKATSAYKEAMAKYLSSPNQALKNLSTLGKTYVEPAIVEAILKSKGINTGNKPVEGFEYNPPSSAATESPESTDFANINNPYALARQKITTDADTRRRNLFATNIEKTISTIDPKAATQYSGVPGMVKKGYESIKSAFGKGSKEYENYLTAQAATKQMAAQVRQFYGESIQPSVREELQNLTNPSYWNRSPKQAEKLFRKYAALLNMETGTFREAMVSPKVYQPHANNIAKGGEGSEDMTYNPMTGEFE